MSEQWHGESKGKPYVEVGICRHLGSFLLGSKKSGPLRKYLDKY